LSTSIFETSHPTHAGASSGSGLALSAWLSALRRRLLASDEELDLAYLEGATDRYDLEYRLREIDRRRAQRPIGFR
jgi:hypothetical protein